MIGVGERTVVIVSREGASRTHEEERDVVIVGVERDLDEDGTHQIIIYDMASNEITPGEILLVERTDNRSNFITPRWIVVRENETN